MIQLFEGVYERVIGNLRRMKPGDATSREEIRKLIGYLQNQGSRINYFKDLGEGKPIGSGAVESANRFICPTRLTRSRACWIKENGHAMLKIRCAIYNGTFDKVFEHSRKIQTEQHSG